MAFYPNLNLSSLSRLLIANAFCISYLFANIVYTKNLLDWILNFFARLFETQICPQRYIKLIENEVLQRWNFR